MYADQLSLFDIAETSGELETCIQNFKDRTVKAREVFSLTPIDKATAYDFIQRYHYLGKKDFVCSYAYGMWCCGELVGTATFSPPAGVSTIKGWFGLKNDDLSIVELTRLAVLPELNGCNATSFLLSGAIRKLKQHGIRAVITLADAARHVGSIYQVCNFKYYGLSDAKTDFWRYPDMAKNPWGSQKNNEGVWLPRNRKHRYAYILDRTLKCLYEEQTAPAVTSIIPKVCCGGGTAVYDKRFKQWYTCPVCTGRLEKIDNERTMQNVS